MTDELLPYYNRELAFIRNLGREFSKAHPQEAGHLHMSGDYEDPHVSRMIEAFAYLNARTRHKIEDDFPEITESFLGVLYPHFLSPFPSASIVKFRLDAGQVEATDGHQIELHTPLETHSCRFRTCYPVTIWPFEVSHADFHGFPTPVPVTPYSQDAEAVVRIQLDSFSPKVPLQACVPGSLRFFISGSTQHSFPLYELLFNELVGVALAAAPDAEPVLLGTEALQPVGFEAHEGLVDYSPRSFLGYRLLKEFFAFPEKFLFFDLVGLDQATMEKVGGTSHLELFIFLKRNVEELERNVGTRTFQLGCTPVVNLFRQPADPFKANHEVSEYRLIPDPRRPDLHEIFSVDEVEAVSPDGKKKIFAPFYSIQHARSSGEMQAYWYATRRPVGYRDGKVDLGTEVYLSLVDLEMQPTELREWTINTLTSCLNRDLPARIPFDGALPFQITDGGAAIEGNRAIGLTPPTSTLRPDRRQGALWKLISHLSLNHLSLVDNPDGAAALREILALYDLRKTAQTKQMIDGLSNVESRRVTGRVSDAEGGHRFCRGIEVTLSIDEDHFGAGNIFLFSAIMERFLGLYSSINSFTKTVVKTPQRDGCLRKWPPRAGRRVLV